ncbi:MAG: hypothetical protein FWG45_02240 [Oscillospiraceae bacterium]|nr:hypothetical protein [Oscillospiraceae bacterium]
MTVTTLGQKLPDNNDFYDVEVFNNNFKILEAAIDALTKRVNIMSTVIAGIMSANSTVNLGFKPSAVIVMSRTLTSETNSTQSTAGTNWNALGRNIALAVASNNGDQRHPATPSVSGCSTLEILETGFKTNVMLGGLTRPTSTTNTGVQEVLASSTETIRYIAFR